MFSFKRGPKILPSHKNPGSIPSELNEIFFTLDLNNLFVTPFKYCVYTLPVLPVYRAIILNVLGPVALLQYLVCSCVWTAGLGFGLENSCSYVWNFKVMGHAPGVNIVLVNLGKNTSKSIFNLLRRNYILKNWKYI